MIGESSVLAVVPARSGSTGLPDKNMEVVGGSSLIALAAHVASSLSWIDLAIISTDSTDYAAEGREHGLLAPFIRPPELSGPGATALDTAVHALDQAEAHFEERFDLIVWLEPTSPNRSPADVEAAVRLLLSHDDIDSVASVSEIDTKYHPEKLLEIRDHRLTFHSPVGASITARQELQGRFLIRNGSCYALRRRCLSDRRGFITEATLPLVIDRPLANIDTPTDLAWARFLWSQTHADP